MSRNNTKTTVTAVIAAVAATAIVLLFLGVGGGIEYQFDDSSFLIHTHQWKDRTVSYADIERVELRDDIYVGKRINAAMAPKSSIWVHSEITNSVHISSIPIPDLTCLQCFT